MIYPSGTLKTVAEIGPKFPVPSQVTPEIRRPNVVLKSGRLTLMKTVKSYFI
jgi:hypothetical protein